MAKNPALLVQTVDLKTVPSDLAAIERRTGVAPSVHGRTVESWTPAAAYLASLSTLVSRRSMVSSLNKAAWILCKTADWRVIDWRGLDAAIVAAVLAQTPGAPSTRNKMLSALKGVARAAFRLNVLSSDDYHRIRDVKGDSGSREPSGRDLKPGEIAELIRVCCDDPTPAGARDAALFTLATVSGARRSEIAYLMMEDFIEPPVLFSEEPTAKTEPASSMLTLRVIGKRNKERKIYLHSGALDAMMDWLVVRGDDPGSIFCAINKSGKVFTDRIITTAALDYILKKRMLKAGIAPMTWHDFRRTTAGNLLDAGVDISTAAGILGHSNVDTTARYDRRGARARLKASNKLSVPYFGRPDT